MRFKYLDRDVPLSVMIRIRQRIAAPRLENLKNSLQKELERVGRDIILKSGENIVIAVGNRRITGLVELVRGKEVVGP